MTTPPVRERGTRSRAGNAMGRTRVAVLEGALRGVEKYGTRRTTMADIATLAGVAKATLYNHFRTKDDVYAAAVDAAVRDLGGECVELAGTDLSDALAAAAERLSGHPAARRVAAEEPAVLAGLVSVGDGPLWQLARAQVGAALAAAGRRADAADLVLRWLVSHLAAPASAGHIRAAAAALDRGLPAAADAGGAPAGPASTTAD